MKIKAHREKCTGHARCAAIAPEIFELDDEGYTAVDEIEVTPGSEEIARRGINACPERVFEIIDE